MAAPEARRRHEFHAAGRRVPAQRWIQAGDADNNAEGHALVLFGTWRTGPPTQWTAPARAGAVPTAAHVISVEFTGDPSRIEPMLQAINYQSLRTAFTK